MRPLPACFLLDLMADHAANGGAANRAGRASACQYRPDERACTGTDRRIFIVRGHAGASRQAEYEGDGRRMYCQFFYRVHF
jgi:hypothetical protein